MVHSALKQEWNTQAMISTQILILYNKAAVAQWLERLIIKRLANTSIVARFSFSAPV
jgi:hypothetical protein